jgi:hypothetical protein
MGSKPRSTEIVASMLIITLPMRCRNIEGQTTIQWSNEKGQKDKRRNSKNLLAWNQYHVSELGNLSIHGMSVSVS